MCANVTPQASPSPTVSTGRSLLSRLTGPLRSRTKYFSDFHIRPLEPYRQYAPGDVIEGLVVFTVVKPFWITHLTVTLHGFVRVYKNQVTVTDNAVYEPALTGSSKHAQYFGNGHASLFQDEIILCGEGRLDAGVYEFEFHLDLPRKGLPTSIDVSVPLSYRAFLLTNVGFSLRGVPYLT
jgi:arrestin-related trafficking adapter 9